MIWLWIAGYGAVYTAARYLCSIFEPGSWLLSICMAVYAAAFLLWSLRQKGSGLKKASIKAVLPYPGCWLMALLPLFNLFLGGCSEITSKEGVLLVSGAVVEELLFRGYLLYGLRKLRPGFRCLISGLVFAGLHGGNLLSGMDIGYGLMQMAVAFVTGICYSAGALRLGSILPALVAHILVNLTGSGNTASGFGWYVLLCGLGSCWLLYDIEKEKEYALIY